MSTQPDTLSGWQPIETAPKDGTIIDLWCNDNDSTRSTRRPDCQWGDMSDWNGEIIQGWRNMYQPHADWTPTHWRHRPSPPEAQEGAESWPHECVGEYLQHPDPSAAPQEAREEGTERCPKCKGHIGPAKDLPGYVYCPNDLCDMDVAWKPSPTDSGEDVERRRLQGCCIDCGRKYGDEYGFPDLVVPNEIWSKISPTGDDGGLLCPSCICRRAYDAGVENIAAKFTSGPFAHNSQNAPISSSSPTDSGEDVEGLVERADKLLKTGAPDWDTHNGMIEELAAALRSLSRENEALSSALDAAMSGGLLVPAADRDRLQREVEALREALKVYANPRWYEREQQILVEGGRRARAALAGGGE